LIELNLRDEIELREAFQRLHEQAVAFNGDILVQEMVNEVRELAIGMIRDPQFGPTVMFGLGGIFAEILDDVSFRVAPIEMHDAMEMIEEIRAYKILNAIRGMDAVDIKVLSKSLIVLGNIGLEHEDIQEIDVNPLIIKGDKPVAVDALIILKEM
jgi:acetyl-CoA synthetase (ADP-forming)